MASRIIAFAGKIMRASHVPPVAEAPVRKRGNNGIRGQAFARNSAGGAGASLLPDIAVLT